MRRFVIQGSDRIGRVIPLSREIMLWTAVLAGAAALFLVQLGARGVVSEEMRWGEVAREMRASGDYFHPTINGRIYYDKPLGSYWLIVAASHLTGGVNETAARLPAAVAGWVGVLLVMLLGRRFYDTPTALLAGAILATSFGFVFYSRRATADVETVTGVLAAVWLYARNVDRPAGAWVVLLWLVMAITSLTKGLLGFALPAVVLAVHGCWIALAEAEEGESIRGRARAILRRNRWLFSRWSVVAIPLAMAVYLAPFFSSIQGTGASEGLAMVWRENVRRFVSPHNHTGPVYLYVGVLFLIAAPWSAFLPAALVPFARGRGGAEGDRLVRAYFWAVFLFFTASASRRGYYLLPILPAVALLVARLSTASADELRPWSRAFRSAGWVVFVTGVACAGVAIVPPRWILPAPYSHLPDLPARWAFMIGWLIGLVALVTLVRSARSRNWVVAGIAFAGLGYGFWVALPAVDDFRTRQAFALEVRTRTDHEPDKLALFHAETVVFDLGRTAPEYSTPEALGEAIRLGRVRWVVARRRYLLGADLPARIVYEESTHLWEGADQMANKLLLLEATGEE